MEPLCKFCGYDKNILLETEHWIVALHDKQTYLGRSYVIAKRHCNSLTSLNSQEWEDLSQVTKVYERIMKEAFDATLFNWSCLTNHAFREKPYNPHVHWHVRPRYNHAVKLLDHTFIDPNFGNHYDRSQEKEAETVLHAKIFEYLSPFFSKKCVPEGHKPLAN